MEIGVRIIGLPNTAEEEEGQLLKANPNVSSRTAQLILPFLVSRSQVASHRAYFRR